MNETRVSIVFEKLVEIQKAFKELSQTTLPPEALVQLVKIGLLLLSLDPKEIRE